VLTDNFKRKLDYLRVSLTDKCNLRCIYCMPPEGMEALSHDDVLRNEEFVHFIELFAGLGIRKIRFTGGEPLVRNGFLEIVSKTATLFPDIELCLTTNGILLDEVLNDIYSIGLKKLNISLDTMSRERYHAITGRDEFDRVISNIERAIAFDGFDLKINAVLFDDSLNSLDDFLEYFKDKRITLRFIEKMPFLTNDRINPDMTSDKLINLLKTKGYLERNKDVDTNVAQMFTLFYKKKYNIKIGIIPPITHKFCNRCNRLRLTCDGFLKTCLYFKEEYDLKSLYRMDMGDDALRNMILKAIKAKQFCHNFDGDHKIENTCSAITSRAMSRIGG
jgi:GTP 3',8-cyclase